MLGFYFGQSLGMLLILLAVLWVFLTPLRGYIRAIIQDLAGKSSSKLLVLALLALIPSIVTSLAPASSLQTWILTIICLMLFVILAVFAYAKLAQKLLTCKMMLLSLLLFHIFIVGAIYLKPELLIAIWDVRQYIGVETNKIPVYYTYNTPKLLLNGTFIVMPLLCYVAFRYLSIYWRLLTVVNVGLLLWMVIILSNRAVLAGGMAILLVE